MQLLLCTLQSHELCIYSTKSYNGQITNIVYSITLALYQSGSSDRLLDWPTVQRNLPWNVVILLGSGFALATGAQQSGLSQWIGSKLHSLKHLSTKGIAFLITVIITTVTEVMSNVATTTLFLPILAELVKIHSLLYILVIYNILLYYNFT